MANEASTEIAVELEETLVPSASDIRRGDMIHINPDTVSVNEVLNGRTEPHDQASIEGMAVSLIDNKQQQLVQVRKMADKSYQLVLGYRRTLAARKIRQGFTFTTADGGERTIHDPNFMLQAKMVTVNDETALVNNIVENRHRKTTTVIDDVHNMDRLRENYGYDDEQIATLFQMKVTEVKRVTPLLTLSRAHQKLVHSGSLPVTVALEIIKLPEDKRDEAIKAAMNDSGKVQGSVVRKSVRAHAQNKAATGKDATKGGKDTKPKGKRGKGNVSRTVKEVSDFLEVERKSDGMGGEFAARLLAFVRGEVDDATFKGEWDQTFSTIAREIAAMK